MEPLYYLPRFLLTLTLPSCVFQVWNGHGEDAPRQRFCGTVPEGTQVRSSMNMMTVVFRTDVSNSYGGFSASYSSNEAAGQRGYQTDDDISMTPTHLTLS